MREENKLPQKYYKLIAKYDILNPQEEVRIFKKIETLNNAYYQADTEAEKTRIREDINRCKHTIVFSNMRLIISIARNFIDRGIDMAALIDEGTIGLMEAAERFDYRKGFRFATYATWWVRQTIVKALGDQGASLRLPVRAIYILKKQSMTYNELAQEYGREPELREIATQLGIPEKKLRDLMEVAQHVASLDDSLDEAGKDGYESLVDEQTSREIDHIFDREIISKTLGYALRKLSGKETEVLRLRYGLESSPQLTLEETCRAMGITRERVRQIQKRALEKMRNAKDIRYLKTFMP